MKSNVRLALALSAVLLSASSAHAQPAPLDAPMIAPPPIPPTPRAKAPLDEANWRAIRVKNVRPSLIAYQLDMAHNKWPAFINTPALPGNVRDEMPPNAPAGKRVKGPFDLPDGMRLVASDEQNLLFVAGGDAQQIEKLQELVDMLDQPLKLVEIEAQIVELPTDQMKGLGIAYQAATPGVREINGPIAGMFQTGFVRGNFQERLDEMVELGTAKIFSTKPLILTNNMGQAISMRNGPIDNTGAKQNKPLVAPTEGTDMILTLTPTIHGDNTITVLMDIATLPTNISASGLMSVVNVRDGDTIALSGLKLSAFPRLTDPKVPKLDQIPLMNSTATQNVPLLGDIPINGKLFRSKKIEDENTVLLFVAARLVRDENEK